MKRSVVTGAASGVLLALAPAVAHAAVVAEWRMNEKAGATTMVDSATGVGGANNGTVTSVKTGVAPLVSGAAYQFGGTTSHVRVPDNAAFDPGSKAITLAATVKISGSTMNDDSYDVVRKGLTTTAGGYWKMEIKRSDANAAVGNLRCVFKVVKSSGSLATVTFDAPVDVVNGAKHSLKCVKSGSTVKAIVDGQTFTGTAPTGSISNADSVFVGSKMPGDDVLQGVVDQVTVSIG